MDRIFKYLLTSFIAAAMLTACGRKDAGKAEMGADEAAVEFCRAVACGDFAGAWELCDSLTMKEYIQGREEAWKMLQKQDSSALAIAAEMLAEAEVTVDEIVKEGDSRHVFCSISLDGKKKNKLFIMKKEEGEWKVTGITDRD